MKVKVSEAKNLVLDYLVAECEQFVEDEFEPSENWGDGGPIIEREGIATWFERYEDEDAGLPCWFAAKYGEREYPGPTLLIAGMRCYVASKLGDKVEVPDELMEV